MEDIAVDLAIAAAHVLAQALLDIVSVDDDPEKGKHVLVFGSAGVGKTSFINALTGESMQTNAGTRGVTLKSQEVGVSRDGVDYRIIDTAGLDEADGGDVSGADAVRSLVKLLKCSSEE